MTAKHFILATAGHVDHGKSTLVKGLTGTDPDRLPEEKLRGITIDLGFAELNLAGPNNETFCVGIVDVPGHEDFVRNMIAGVGSIDLALLVVAADDGWMPQTEEHLQILTYLGVQRAVVALTKTDIGHADKVEDEIRDRLRDTHFANAPTIRTSFDDSNVTALSSHVAESTISELKNALAAEFARLEPARDIGKPRLFVDRAFALRGVGTVVTGTLTGGRLSRGQTVCIQPKNIFGRIRSIQSHGRDLESVGPATRAAINLTDVEVGDGPGAVHRGEVITLSDLGEVSETIDAIIERSTRVDRKSVPARPIKNGRSINLHHGTSRVSAEVVLFRAEAIDPGERTLAQLRLASPVFASVGDRFVLRDASEQFTIGGGVVLALNSDRENLRKESRRNFLAGRAEAIDDVDLCVQSELSHDQFAGAKTLLRQSHFSENEIADALIRLRDREAIVLRGEFTADASVWSALLREATSLIDEVHRQHPERRGLDLATLRANLPVSNDDAFDALTTELCANGFVRDGSAIARASHRPQLPPNIQPGAEQVRAALATKPFDPPNRKEFANVQTALRFLIEQGEVIDLSSDVVVSKDASEQMRNKVIEFIARQGTATASELRQHLGMSRRVIIPFLEYLDRNGVTRRAGDKRVLVK